MLATNVPTDGWYVALLSNSFIIAAIKMGFSNLFIPWSATLVANILLSNQRAMLTSESIIELNKVKLVSSLATDLTSKILAPIILIFVLDDSCARFYLLFDDDLLEMLRNWGLAQQGVAALREGLCTRRLIEDFGVVWLTVLVLSTLLDSWVDFRIGKLSQKLSSWQIFSEITNQVEDEVDLFAEACADAQNVQQELVSILSTLMMSVIFGNLSS